MDDMVRAALKKWPDVPACTGWLALDARGDWYMRDDRTQAAGAFNNQRVAAQFIPRTHAEILRYFAGLELVEPGLVPLPEWRGPGTPAEWIPAYGGVARKRLRMPPSR